MACSAMSVTCGAARSCHNPRRYRRRRTRTCPCTTWACGPSRPLLCLPNLVIHPPKGSCRLLCRHGMDWAASGQQPGDAAATSSGYVWPAEETTVGDWVILDTLGVGAFGRVVLAQRAPGELAAIKLLPRGARVRAPACCASCLMTCLPLPPSVTAQPALAWRSAQPRAAAAL